MLALRVEIPQVASSIAVADPECGELRLPPWCLLFAFSAFAADIPPTENEVPSSGCTNKVINVEA